MKMRDLMRQHKHGANLNWEICGHPPYSPLGSNKLTFTCSQNLKQFLYYFEELKQVMTTWLKMFAAEEYIIRIETLVLRYNKCLKNRSEHVEN